MHHPPPSRPLSLPISVCWISFFISHHFRTPLLLVGRNSVFSYERVFSGEQEQMTVTMVMCLFGDRMQIELKNAFDKVNDLRGCVLANIKEMKTDSSRISRAKEK